MKNKVLITGNLGFVGRNLTDYLDERKVEWVGFDLKEGFDIRNKFDLDSACLVGNFDTVIHLSALTGVPRGNEYYKDYIDTNITGTQNLLEVSKKYGVKQFIFYSSSSVYGGADKKLKETDPMNPLSIYGITKVAGESLVKNSGLKYSIIRPFCIFGEKYGKEFSVIYKWINQIKNGHPVTFFGYGKSSRGYTNVWDIIGATYVVYLMGDSQLTNQTINLGGSEVVSLYELYEIFEKFCGEHDIQISRTVLPKPDYDIKNSFADVRKAKKLLGYKPEEHFELVVRKILEKELI